MDRTERQEADRPDRRRPHPHDLDAEAADGAVERFIALGECTSLDLGRDGRARHCRRRDRRARAEADAAGQDGGRARRSPCATSGGAPIRASRRSRTSNGMAEFEAHNLAEDGDVLVISGVSGVSNMGGISAYTAPASGRARRHRDGRRARRAAFALDRLSGLGERDHADHRQVAARDGRDQRRDPDGRRAGQSGRSGGGRRHRRGVHPARLSIMAVLELCEKKKKGEDDARRRDLEAACRCRCSTARGRPDALH